MAASSHYTKVLTVTRLVALASFVALAGLIYVRYNQVITDVGSITAAQRVGGATLQVVESARDLDLAARGFVITGREDFLTRHEAAKTRLAPQVDRLKAALPDDAEQRERGDALLSQVSRLVDVADQMIAARQREGPDAAREAMLASDEPSALNTVRDTAESLQTVTRQHITSERAASAMSRRLTGYLMLGTFFLAVAMLTYAGWQVHKELGRRGHAEGRLLLANADVEHQVQVRTEELVRANDTRDDLLRREQVARADAEMANRIKDEFLAAVSHELRTPLNAIVGWSHILKIDNGENRARAVEAIERNALIQARLIDDLLDLSRLTRGRFGLTLSTIDLGTAVQSALVTIGPDAAAKNVTVVVRADDNVCVRGDDARLQQVAWNLLSNAVKFTPPGGQVTVDVSRLGHRARLRVTDTGEGIEPEFLPHVFEPFKQAEGRARRLGLGLGLSIVRQIVELLGGSILAASEGLHQGSSFTVVLPLSEVAATAAPAASGHPSQLNVRVLVVEDDEDSAVTLSTLLVHHGCDVRIAHSVAEAEAEFTLARPDVLLCDIGLPDGDGYMLLRHLRAISNAPVPAIALSALARDEDRARAADAGFSMYLTKPFDVDQLFDAIFKVTAAKAG